MIHLFELLTIGLSASVLNAKKFLGEEEVHPLLHSSMLFHFNLLFFMDHLREVLLAM